jgi:hypothetical protein
VHGGNAQELGEVAVCVTTGSGDTQLRLDEAPRVVKGVYCVVVALDEVSPGVVREGVRVVVEKVGPRGYVREVTGA